jgi:hypothetical protein
MLNTSTLRPGLLVALSTSVRGNVSYAKQTIEADHTTPEGERRARWETERTIVDPVEHEAAALARGKASNVIRRVCAQSAFGLLCPEAESDKLAGAIAEARRIQDAFNATAKVTRLSVNVMTGRIAPDDVEAVKAINSEIRDLMDDMQEGLANLDVKKVREAARRAKSVGQMLSPDATARVQVAIDLARASATAINKAGEQVAVEVDRSTIRRIAEQRTAFLDIDTDGKEIAAPVTTGRAIDLSPLDALSKEQLEKKQWEEYTNDPTR